MGETQENWVTHQNGQSPHHKYHPQLKTKEDAGVVSQVLKGKEGNSQGGEKEQSLENRCLCGHTETEEHRGEPNKQVFLGSSLSTT